MTPDYASPEQVRGEPITTATDVYSLGAVLYELLTGRRAHHVERFSPGEIERVICTREPKKPSAVAKHLDSDLDNIVLMALRKEPLRRYASVEQFSEDIRLYLEDRPVRARKDTVRYRASKFLRRNTTGVALAILALIAVAAGVIAIDRQARRAEHRFQQVRKLANTVLIDLNREIESLAGSTKARELLVKTSLEYLDSLAADSGGDAALQLELAAAYEKVGDVQGNPMFSHLGHPKASVESYAKSLAIAEKLQASELALEIAARSHYKLGCVYNWGLGRASDAREHMRRAVLIANSIPAKTGHPAWRLRAEAHGFLGDLETYRDPAAALDPLRRSLEIAREWHHEQPESESRYFVAIAMGRLGAASQETGDLQSALSLFLSSLRFIEQLISEQPENAIWRRERDATYDRLGWVTGHPQYFNLGDRKTAQGWVRKLAFGGAEQLLAADPNNVRARFELSEATAALAAVTRESNPAGAAQFYRRSLELSTAVLAANPDDAIATYWQAFNRVGFAWVLRRLDHRENALEELRKAVDLLQRLRLRDPHDARFQEYLGLALQTRAAHRLEIGDRTGAEQDLQQSLDILEPLYRANPRKLTRLRDLADCYQGWGDLHASRSELKLAHSWYQRSLELWERWPQVGTTSVYDQQRREAAARRVAAALKTLQEKTLLKR